MMENRPDITLAQRYAASLDWWRLAGVDCDFADEAQNWLAEPADAAGPPAAGKPAAQVKAAETAPEPAVEARNLPASLEAFRAWWMDEASPLPGDQARRIAPRGAAGAPLMLIVPMPETGDGEALLSGPQGRLLANIARALGLAPDVAYLASALPSAMPMPDWDALAADGLGAALLRHIELARPERVLLLGSALPALLGHDRAAPPESLAQVAGIPALASFAPERLIDHPRQRARLWQRLLEWTA
jgi:DNA polymerase